MILRKSVFPGIRRCENNAADYGKVSSNSGPQFYFVLRENQLIGYNFLIGDTRKYKAFPWLAVGNMDEQKLTVCEELMKLQIVFFRNLECTI